jgi:hypothetical protein
MPRRAPDQVQEMRVTFGNYEREFVTEVKNDIEKGVKIATITAVAVPATIVIGAIGGLGSIGLWYLSRHELICFWRCFRHC